MKISLPLDVFIPLKTREDKKIILNLNVYRNAHHMTLNQAKMEFKRHVELLALNVKDLCPMPFTFSYTVYPGSGRAFDLGNVCSIIQKFTDDALIELGIIKDDSYKVVRKVVYRFGEIDKENQRAELEIKPWKEDL